MYVSIIEFIFRSENTKTKKKERQWLD